GDRRAAFAAYRAALIGSACAQDTSHADPARREDAQRSLAALALEHGDPGTAATIYAGLPDAAARTGRGFALLKMHRADEALTELGRALPSARDDADARLGRALALEGAGPPPAEAAAALRAFLARAPQHPAAPEARSRLARIAVPQ